MIVLFDGVCHLCQWSVRFIIECDPKGIFKFVSLQDHPQYGEGSVVLVEGDEVHRESSAALRIAKRLKGPIKLLYAFIIVPRPARDVVYRFIARNRYKWFGKDDACWLPTPELKARFLVGDPKSATPASLAR